MLTVVTDGVPRLPFATLLKVMLKDSFCSLVMSSVMKTAKLLDDSPGAKVIVPDAAM